MYTKHINTFNNENGNRDQTVKCILKNYDIKFLRGRKKTQLKTIIYAMFLTIILMHCLTIKFINNKTFAVYFFKLYINLYM